jgi:hypothetical protein
MAAAKTLFLVFLWQFLSKTQQQMEVHKCEKCGKEAKGVAEYAATFATYKLNGEYVFCKTCKDCNPEANVTCFTCHDDAKTIEEASVKFAESFKQAVAKEGKSFRKDSMECVKCVKQREKEQQEEEQRQREAKLEEERRKREADEKRLKELGLVSYEDMDYKFIFTDAVVDKFILDHITSDPFPSGSSNASSVEEFASFGHLSDVVPVPDEAPAETQAQVLNGAEASNKPSSTVSNRDALRAVENSDNSPAFTSHGVMVFWAHVAEDLLNLAHDKPGHRNVFMRKTVTNEHGDALELYTLNRKGVLEARTVVEGYLANQPFNKAIFAAIKSGIVRYWSNHKAKISVAGEGSDALKAALAACDKQMSQWLRSASEEICRNTHWMKNVLLRYGRLYADEEREKKAQSSSVLRRKSAGAIGQTATAKQLKGSASDARGYESDPVVDYSDSDHDRHERRRRRRTIAKDEGKSAKRERSPSARKSGGGGASSGKPPRKKAELAESETPGQRKSLRKDADQQDVIDVDDEHGVYISDNYDFVDDEHSGQSKGKRERSRSLSLVVKKESGGKKTRGSGNKGSAKRASSPVTVNKKLNFTEEKIAGFVQKLTEYVEDHPDEPFSTIVEEKPELIAENGPLAACSFRQVGLFYFDLDTGLGVGLTRELAEKYRKEKSFDKNAPLTLSVYKKKKGLAVIVDVIKEGKLFGLVEEAVKHEGLTPYFA